MRRLLADRRGLLAGGAALLGAGLAKLTGPQQAEAAHTGANVAGDPLHADVTNSTTGLTGIDSSAADATLLVRNVGTGRAIVGSWGGSNSLGPQNAGIGVLGQSHSKVGVRGEAISSAGVLGIGAVSPSLVAAPSGVFGVAGVSTGGTGIYGQSNSGVGAVGSSGGNIGVYGASSNNVGVFGDADVNTAVMGRTGAGIGVYGTASRPGQGGRAAVFDGTVLVNGPFTVVGGPKSAGLRHPDGSHRRVYCQESPEPWLEDFGTATLRDGRAEITLDPDFDAVVKGDAYLVFLTEIGDCGGLYAGRQGPHRFEVRSRGGASTGGSFNYRVVARRRDDVGKRLEKVDVRPAQSKDIKAPDLSAPATPARGASGPDERR